MSDPAPPTTLADLQSEAISSIASVSTLLRNAIAASLSVAPEQYLTVAIPGTVIDLADYDQGGSFVYDVSKHATAPTTVRQSEASLVDGMMPIAATMIGTTGKSVARSYSRALDALLPAKATISSVDGIRSPGNANYDKAMQFLTSTTSSSGTNVVEVYRQKQLAWAKERCAWDTARIEVAKRAAEMYPPGSDPDYLGKQKKTINDWNEENYLTYKSGIQGAWMDWVVNGRKYDVDYDFGMIDVDSIMGRIESSKESLRNSVIPDPNGAAEVYGVSLTPNKWATYCKRKAEGWYERKGNFSLAQVDSEISRLNSLLESYQSASQLVNTLDGKASSYPVNGATKPAVDLGKTKKQVIDKLSALYEANANLLGAKYNLKQLQDAKADTTAAQAKVDDDQALLTKAQQALKSAEDENLAAQQTINEYNRMVLDESTRASATNWIAEKVATIKREVERLQALRASKAQSSPVDIPVISGLTLPDKDKKGPTGVTLANDGSELANPIFKSASADGEPLVNGEDVEPWTNITFSYSATDMKNISQGSQLGTNVGGSVGFGLWSVGGSYSHDESHQSVLNDMAACDVSISFSALVVNINRPWLYGELFSDSDLEVAQGVQLSPGPALLQQLIKEQKLEEIATWSQFPAYPTSFIVAADTTIEFTGPTSHIQKHFDTYGNSGASVGYGPWTVSRSVFESGSAPSVQVHSTATGCKISFGAPQIIAWVSQIVPALPRPQDYNPLTQGGSVPVPNGNAAV